MSDPHKPRRERTRVGDERYGQAANGSADRQGQPLGYFEIAMSRPILLRSLIIALFVGAILCLINHGACLLNDKFNKMCLIQAVMTAFVPFLVSLISSVYALRKESLNR